MPARADEFSSDAYEGLRAGVLALRAELADLAFALERRGRADAADLAAAVAARLGELCAGERTGESAALATPPGAVTPAVHDRRF